MRGSGALATRHPAGVKRTLDLKREQAGADPGNFRNPRVSRPSRGSRKARQFSGISQVLGSVLDQAGLGFLAYEEKLRQHWPELMGPRAAAIAKLESLKGWTLKVRVESATWRNELHFQKDALRKRANELLGADLVRDIQLL
jgi:predicted nucleic acid-binding Zn ribbon protein